MHLNCHLFCSHSQQEPTMISSSNHIYPNTEESISSSAAPTVLSTQVKNGMLMPSADKLESELSPREVCQMVIGNNCRLIGLIQELADKKIPIPKFGFSGQGASGLKRILESKRSGSSSEKDCIWVAGYDSQLDPISFIADLTTLARTALNYSVSSEGSGILICRLDHDEISYVSSKIGFSPQRDDIGFESIEGIDDKTLKIHEIFYRLCHRNQSDHRITLRDACRLEALSLEQKGNWKHVHFDDFPSSEILNAVTKQPDLSSMAIGVTNEMLLKFNPANFDERVVGVIEHVDMTITTSLIHSLFEQTRIRHPGDEPRAERSYQNLKLADCLREQEIVASALKSLGLTDNVSPKKWEEMQEKGKSLLESIETVTRHKKDSIHFPHFWE